MAVLAVDPSSPFSGGALLGDRVRMQQHALDPGVFIRSMATRGHLGGLAVAAPQAIRVLDAAGFDTVLVETVGVGQSEVDVAGQVDVTLVLLAPGMGDGIQAAKAGVLEIGDLFVVNKADRDGAHAVVRELRNMVALAQRAPEDWKPPVLTHERRGRHRHRRAAGRARPVRRARRRLGPARRDGVGTGRAGRSSRWCMARLRAALPTHGRSGLDGARDGGGRRPAGRVRGRRSGARASPETPSLSLNYSLRLVGRGGVARP